MAFKSQLIAQLEGKEIQQKAANFAIADDLNESAGLLLGVHQGDAGFGEFLKALKASHVPHVVEKAKMLTSGQYRGVKLIVDNLKVNPQFVTWRPKNKKVNGIIRQHKEEYPREAWFEAFPHLAEHIEHMFAREQGVFVPYKKPRSNCHDKRHFKKP